MAVFLADFRCRDIFSFAWRWTSSGCWPSGNKVLLLSDSFFPDNRGLYRCCRWLRLRCRGTVDGRVDGGPCFPRVRVSCVVLNETGGHVTSCPSSISSHPHVEGGSTVLINKGSSIFDYFFCVRVFVETGLARIFGPKFTKCRSFWPLWVRIIRALQWRSGKAQPLV
jgi:hypothetical protein